MTLCSNLSERRKKSEAPFQSVSGLINQFRIIGIILKVVYLFYVNTKIIFLLKLPLSGKQCYNYYKLILIM